MNPVDFPESNMPFGAPSGWDESQCATIRAFAGPIQGGSLDGEHQVIVAWTPTAQELKDIVNGKPIFISMIGGLMPHYLCTSFADARNVA